MLRLCGEMARREVIQVGVPVKWSCVATWGDLLISVESCEVGVDDMQMRTANMDTWTCSSPNKMGNRRDVEHGKKKEEIEGIQSDPTAA